MGLLCGLDEIWGGRVEEWGEAISYHLSSSGGSREVRMQYFRRDRYGQRFAFRGIRRPK